MTPSIFYNPDDDADRDFRKPGGGSQPSPRMKRLRSCITAAMLYRSLTTSDAIRLRRMKAHIMGLRLPVSRLAGLWSTAREEALFYARPERAPLPITRAPLDGCSMPDYAAAAWLVVNVPVAVGAFDGWSKFYRLNSTRGADWGSIWYYFEVEHAPVLGGLHVSTLNLVSLLLFAVGCVLIGLLTLTAPQRPRVPQVFFLILAVFLLVNKVWSPQYVIWLVPLVVLARPRIWSWAVWQVAEIGYFFAIWAYLIPFSQPGAPGAIGPGLYFAALLARFGTVALLGALVVRDILRPGKDVVRASGEDDPAGGILDGAPDAVVLGRARLAAAR